MDIIQHHRADAAPVERALGLGERIEQWLHRPGMARVILVGSLIVTALAWWAARHFALDDARQRFERKADDVHLRIASRMTDYQSLLRGGVALFAAQGEVTRDAWRRYARVIQPEKNFPGIQGFGVTRLLQPSQLQEFEDSVRAEGFGAFSVRPKGPRAEYSSIVYLEPMDRRNQRAFGYDMLSEATRREAMQRARATGKAALSGIVTLVQEDGKDVQKGFLMYVPVYRSAVRDGVSVDTAPGATALWGWVYAPFRVRDLMSGILGTDQSQIAFRIHDGPATDAGQAFYASDALKLLQGDRTFEQQRPLEVAGRTWTVVYQGRDFGAAADTWQSNLVAVVGLSIDLLLYWSIASLTRRKSQFEREVGLHAAEARERTKWLTAVTGLSPDGILVFQRDERGLPRLVFTNPAFSRWFGLQPAEMLGLTEDAVDEWLEGLAPPGERMPALALGDADVILAGPPRRVLRRGMRESSQERVYYFRDVTHETEVQALKSEFLSTAAHELRTPLASVYGFSELMLDGKIDTAKRSRAARIVYRQAGVLKHLVDELLDLARIDARRGRDFALERLDLRRIADLAAESLLQPDEMPRINLALGTDPMWVDADPAKMQQAIVNVLSNALKYSTPPSSVSLSTQITRRDGRAWVALRVVDCGMGMAPDQVARAFERFYRADPSGHIPGAGLGLSIVKEILELHQGQVELHSTPGAGTQVTLWLPLKGPIQPPAPPEGLPRLAAPAAAPAEA